MKLHLNKIINRHSIRFKLTFTLTLIIIFTIFTLLFLNMTLLEDYYLHSKIKTLGETYDEINAIFKKSDDMNTTFSQDKLKLQRLMESRNVSINIIANTGWYDRSEWVPFENDDKDKENERDDKEKDERYDQILQWIKGYIFGEMSQGIKSKKILSREKYNIFMTYDPRIDSNYVDLVGDLEDGNVFIRTNLESIQESVQVANKFLAYVGMVAVIIASIIMFYFSRRFSKPILQLAGISKRMSDLDFDAKYFVTTQDEIGELGSSINILSEKLEKTISELKGANNELLSDIQNKIQIDEMRKDFLSNVTHELKTPIALIQGYAEGLKDNINDDADSRDFYCEVIIDEAKKMNEMVKKLLSLNQIEAGNNQINIERFDIVAIIHSVLDSAEILIQQKEVLLHFEHKEPIYVWADEYMVEEVVTNYVSNALNHVDGAKIIEIKLIQQENSVRIAVFNTGANIPEEDLDKIWIKFYKVDKARTREYGGSGIGLSIVKAIMSSLNQDCGVINHETGVEFWFELDTKIN
ncbi:sensor histidine kinase [Anaerocolumna sp. MB42-C2]|uniref:sensor histidine kinase n=1 Tax=Anaerocolumna sp. MB42-C2 TaxID=3070997 RepID=UPI0027E0AB6D|nr:HAMP domain-containing sensor histidine kinase [Anaerocolumna sp. MB42-C2]WMJ87719.1 HAMP domain-containing sensor histidine kinase [Anaerocolumna sp. MB42-C2]